MGEVPTTLRSLERNPDAASTAPNATYLVTIYETGLPMHLGGVESWDWTVVWLEAPSAAQLNGTFNTTFSPELTLNLPNGTYRGWVEGPCCEPAYMGEPLYLTFQVAGAPLDLVQPMAPAYLVRLTVTWVGGFSVNASCTFAAYDVSPCSGDHTFELANGTYPFTFDPIPGFYLATPPVIVVVNGANTTAEASIVPDYFITDFVESGLPNGTQWYVGLLGIGPAPSGYDAWQAGPVPGPSGPYYPTGSSTGFPLARFGLANGTYRFLIDPIPGYTAWPANGTFTLNGTGTIVTIFFTAIVGSTPPPVQFYAGAGIGGVLGFLLGCVVAWTIARARNRRGALSRP